LTSKKSIYIIGKEEREKEKKMTNDFAYNMSEINEEEIYKGWEEMANEDGEVFLVGYGIPGDEADEEDYIHGFDDGEDVEDGYDEDFWGDQYFA
jgi:hypothetical protein